MVQEIIDEAGDLPMQPFIGPNAVEVGISFQYMQVGVHGLFLIGIFGT